MVLWLMRTAAQFYGANVGTSLAALCLTSTFLQSCRVSCSSLGESYSLYLTDISLDGSLPSRLFETLLLSCTGRKGELGLRLLEVVDAS